MPNFTVKKQAGFSLMELVVVTLIIGILAATSIPLYTGYIQRGYRADAQTRLMEGAVRMQRFFTANNTFATAALSDAFETITTIPANSDNPMYTLSFDGAPTAGTFTLQAVPSGSQDDDECGTLRVLSNGQKTAAVNTCWQ